ncbi:hypothetical protein [Algibacillus agarilyticus]|uniref:hypothetical protein n=1 Tax=Algibacillus agarilyticus TaxID=2234133 RepID=UPI000DD03BBE|nr:hypothetical protein [Algibacillus agarilyticus]
MISPLHAEVDIIYNQIFMQDIQSVSICASNSGEGCTLLSTLLAQRCLLSGRKTLLVDMNTHKPSIHKLLTLTTPSPCHNESMINNQDTNVNQFVSLTPEIVEVNEHALVGITAPQRKDAILKLRSPDVLKAYIEQWKLEFECIIIDTTPISRLNVNNIPADFVAQASDAAILVVQAGETTAEMVNASIDKLKKSQVNIIGTVINDKHNPTLKQELLRKIKQSRFLPRFISHFVENSIMRNKLMNLSI